MTRVMKPDTETAATRPGLAEDEATITNKMWRSGWQRYVFPSFWLIYLAQVASGVSKHSTGTAAVVGYALIFAFAACYLLAMTSGWSGQTRRFWMFYGLAIAIFVIELPLAQEDAFVCAVYLAVLAVASDHRFSTGIVAALVVSTIVVPALVPSWHTGLQFSTGLIVALVSGAMYGFFNLVRSNIALSEARAEVARLAAENERSRIARDLHDLLGHSLTTITVKASLARRLSGIDPARATQEISEVEELSRRALTDVRTAVSGYHDVTLIGEIASAREVLRAAGVDATLPGAVDVVDPSLQELFGWVTREGVTNIVRHSRAERCEILLGANWIDICDNGKGGLSGAGNGLSGLRERVEAAGGSVTIGGATGLIGFRLRVDVPLDSELVPS
ncbi:two-component system, NarL family, sensor histidine kinase DesK [Frankineae bacterium MT45]|nr:two-component system, NarL family, sensor histidine kinase DesK [Frankineae bacterium MT45]